MTKRKHPKYPSGRPGGTENTWNFQLSYEKGAQVPLKGIEKFAGKDIHHNGTGLDRSIYSKQKTKTMKSSGLP